MNHNAQKRTAAFVVMACTAIVACSAASDDEGASGDDITSSLSSDPEIAKGKPATASSSESASLGPSLAVDGNSRTRWSSAEGSDPQWLRVDLQDRYALSGVSIRWEKAFARAYRVEISDDDAGWEAVYSTTDGDGAIDDIPLSRTARYVRIYGTKRATSWGYSILTLNVYGKPVATPPGDAGTPADGGDSPADGGVPPVVVGFPNATNVGLRVATTRTMGGASIDTASWFGANGFPGDGTPANPYLVDRVLFTGEVKIGGSGLAGKTVKFTNCRFYGSPGNPTPGNSMFVGTTVNGELPARLIVEDSTLGEKDGLDPNGGPAGGAGVDKGFESFTPFEFRRNNVYGACISVYFETERSEAASIIEDNYLHDTWSANGDHTDLVNGNLHASHITVRHNTLDGIRTGGAYVVNAIGIYDDNTDYIADWVIDNNYFDRSQTMILATTDETRFRDPFVLTNNVFARHSVNLVAARSPSVQSGNKDDKGNPLTF
ncbi:discoidin domain-containing protein [Sorangium sp. So ce1128]